MTERPRVYTSRRPSARVRAELERSFRLELHDSDWPPSREALLAGVAGARGFLAMLTDRVDDELLDAAGPQLEIVANYAVGHDNVDLDACVRRGVVVSTTPGVLTEATAELAIALLLALVRRVAEGDRLVRRGEAWIWAPTFLAATGLKGLTLGCVGFGRIGRETARLARAFGMRVVYSNRSGPADGEDGWLPLERLLAEADVVSLHVPLGAGTEHLIDAEALARMKPDAVLVNTSRGPVVDEQALARALLDGRIAGAALDVFEREPEVAPALLELENVVLTPHIGSATRETRDAMGMLCVEALRAVLLEGRRPANALEAT